MLEGLNPLSIGSVFPTYIALTHNDEIGLNPLSIGSVFPTDPQYLYSMPTTVLIPFLSGLFSQQEEFLAYKILKSLNPLSIGSVFPTMNTVHIWMAARLNPLSIGSVFPTY